MGDFLPGFFIMGLIALMGWAIYESHMSDVRFEEKMQTEYSTCIAAKETEYTCKSYVQSMRATKAADDAGTMAAIAVGVSAANGGKR